MSRLRVGLLVNPTAALGTAHRVGRQVSQLLRLAGISVVDISGPSTEVARARAEEVRSRLTALVVVGGDGTVSLGAELVAGSPVRLGVVPAGSGNDFARSLGIPLDDPDAAVRLLLQALSRPVVAIDALEITSADPEALVHRSLAVGSVSLGFDALVNARANGARRGAGTRYVAAVLRELPAFRPIPFRLTIDGQEPEDLDTSLLTIANASTFGGGMRIVPEARVDDGQADMVTLTGLGRSQLLRFFPRVFRGTHTDVPGFRIRPVREVEAASRDGRLLRVYADGEPRCQLPVRVRVLPGAVRILAEPPAGSVPA